MVLNSVPLLIFIIFWDSRLKTSKKSKMNEAANLQQLKTSIIQALKLQYSAAAEEDREHAQLYLLSSLFEPNFWDIFADIIKDPLLENELKSSAIIFIESQIKLKTNSSSFDYNNSTSSGGSLTKKNCEMIIGTYNSLLTDISIDLRLKKLLPKVIELIAEEICLKSEESTEDWQRYFQLFAKKIEESNF